MHGLVNFMPYDVLKFGLLHMLSQSSLSWWQMVSLRAVFGRGGGGGGVSTCSHHRQAVHTGAYQLLTFPGVPPYRWLIFQVVALLHRDMGR